MIVGDLLAVPSGAQNPRGAAEFIRHAATRAQVLNLALSQCKIAPLKDWPKGFFATHANPRLREMKEIMDSSRLLRDPPVPGWLAYLEKIKTAVAAVWSGELGPVQSLRTLV